MFAIALSLSLFANPVKKEKTLLPAVRESKTRTIKCIHTDLRRTLDTKIYAYIKRNGPSRSEKKNSMTNQN